jgi:hypothetical protein
MRREGKCIHFNGTSNPFCEKAVRYEDVTDRSATPASMPCIAKYNTNGSKCELLQLPTAEEIAADRKELDERVEKMVRAREAIVAACGGKWKEGMPGSQGRIDCPACGKPNTLGFIRSGRNGHIHARCWTEGCVSWME